MPGIITLTAARHSRFICIFRRHTFQRASRPLCLSALARLGVSRRVVQPLRAGWSLAALAGAAIFRSCLLLLHDDAPVFASLFLDMPRAEPLDFVIDFSAAAQASRMLARRNILLADN